MAAGNAPLPARKPLRAVATLALAFAGLAQTPGAQVGPLPEQAFTYRKLPFQVKVAGTERRGKVTVRDITYSNTWGERTAAYLVEPPGRAKGPGILFVHWYEPESKNSNRTQFLDQAVDLASDGVTSLPVETMWSGPAWFKKRNPEEDYMKSIAQVQELRRALDLLATQKRVSPDKIAYVGHDFGAMYGAVLAGIDSRPSLWALQAGSGRFSDWYVLGRKLDPEARQKVIEKLAPLDPIAYIGKASPARVLFQFGRQDPYVPEAQARAFFEAAREPKDLIWYNAGHGLDPQAVRDRQEWLRQYLKISSRQ